jgi:hypothetical protein
MGNGAVTVRYPDADPIKCLLRSGLNRGCTITGPGDPTRDRTVTSDLSRLNGT